MKAISVLLFLTLSVLTTSLCLAQQPQAVPQPQRFPDGGTREVLISILIPSLAGAPFTATVRTEWIRQLPDGSSITLKNHRAIARDKVGRIFQERSILVPDDGRSKSDVTQIEISDPVSHRLYICVPSQLVCQLEEFSAPPLPQISAAVKAPKESGGPTEENLGEQAVNGLKTLGTRETVVIPTGQIGNNSPVLLRREFWYSPQLGVNLISKREDPRFGIQNFEVTDIALGDPEPKLFEVPDGSKILDLRKPPELPTPPPSSH